MIERFRIFLDSPLQPAAARAVLALASAILLGFSLLFYLGSRQPDGSSISTEERQQVPTAPAVAVPPPGSFDHPAAKARLPRQDPQDVAGTPEYRRAYRALRSHRALQHLPYRSGEIRIDLVGARGRRAVLRVESSTRARAEAGWRAFLRRFRDRGAAYLPVFKGSTGGRDG